MKYDLQQLGPTGFEDVAAALAVATFGAGVQVMAVAGTAVATCITEGPSFGRREAWHPRR